MIKHALVWGALDSIPFDRCRERVVKAGHLNGVALKQRLLQGSPD